MEISRLNSRHQATVPQAVREFLALAVGDRVRFRIVRGRVVMEKSPAHDRVYLDAMNRALSPEWMSAADEEA